MANREQPRFLGADRHTLKYQDIFKPTGQTPVPESKIAQEENANLKARQNVSLGQLSLDESSNPSRPAYGDKGSPVTLWTNHMKVSMSSEQLLFTYDLVIDDRLGIGRKRQQFIKSAFRQLPELMALGFGVATDYASLVVASAKVDLGPNDHKTFNLGYYDTELPGCLATAPRGKPFKLQMSLIGSLSSSDLSGFMGHDPIYSNRSDTADIEAVRALNVIMASHPNKDPDVYQGGQNKFFRYPSQDTFSNYDLGGGLIAVRGYYCSVRFSTSRILLNVNAQCTPFYKNLNIRELVQEFEKSASGDWPALNKFLVNLRIKTSYMRAREGNLLSKVKTVVGFSHKKELAGGPNKAAEDAEFNLGNANEIRFKLEGRQPEATVSVKEYFLAEYGLALKHPEGIVLNCGTRDNPIWIPAELCMVMPGQPYRGQLNEVQLARMITIAARPPAENASRIMAEDGGLGLIGVLPSPSDNLAAFGVKIDPRMIAVPGRVLTAPKVMYSGKSTAKIVGGSWNMRDKKVLNSATLSDWTTLRIGAAAAIDGEDFERHCKALTTIFKACGLKVNPPQVFPGPTIPALNKTGDNMVLDKAFVDSQLKDIFERCKARKIAMLLVVLPSTKPWIRERVKFWGDTVYGIHNSCVQMNQLQRQDPNYSANVALKVNLKLGGRNQCISPNDLGFLRHGKTMLVGIDVTHPAPGVMKGTPSIAGVVASTDADFGQWPGNICCQESKKEMVSDLEKMMEERLEYWISKNPGQKLENIVVYRDGVSESQYTTVQRVEIPAIREACAKVFKDASSPKITFLIVGKNHHTRLYPTDKNKSDQRHNFNIQNGTVVDRGITMPKGWDFYMAAHAALQGTTKPAHYVVLLDEIKDNNKLSANHLEQITHNLCYLQGRATKAVSVCPPAYYAHLICLRARCYLADYINRSDAKVFDWNQAPWRSGVHESIKNSMFYI